jgi:hypothetical protein
LRVQCSYPLPIRGLGRGLRTIRSSRTSGAARHVNSRCPGSVEGAWGSPRRGPGGGFSGPMRASHCLTSNAPAVCDSLPHVKPPPNGPLVEGLVDLGFRCCGRLEQRQVLELVGQCGDLAVELSGRDGGHRVVHNVRRNPPRRRLSILSSKRRFLREATYGGTRRFPMSQCGHFAHAAWGATIVRNPTDERR